jgi:hypothetical protein
MIFVTAFNSSPHTEAYSPLSGFMGKAFCVVGMLRHLFGECEEKRSGFVKIILANPLLFQLRNISIA